MEVVKGYKYGGGQFVTFAAEELKALDVTPQAGLASAVRRIAGSI